MPAHKSAPIFRTRFYYTLGVSLITLPISFLGFSRTLYGLVNNLPFMDIVFPTFNRFLLIGGIGLIPGSIIVGWLFTKSPFYNASFEIPAERTPFKYRLSPGREIVMQPYSVLGAEMALKVWEKLNVLSEPERVKWEQYLRFLRYMNEGGDLRELDEFKEAYPEYDS